MTTFSDAFTAVARVETQRELYRRGYARACEDVAEALGRLDVGRPAQEIADVLWHAAEQARRGKRGDHVA